MTADDNPTGDDIRRAIGVLTINAEGAEERAARRGPDKPGQHSREHAKAIRRVIRYLEASRP